ncbi:phage head closure protein [Azohydromonas lata]|uniref:phage head closure protein n=1 Tax=Azohydromonas lata TaxID=45677 RepID=UPI000830B8C3|nr:phage head closure protein [Azohydromonas lata]
MGAGQYDTQVDLHKRQSGQDAAGQPVQTWVVAAAGVWADVRHLSGLEAIKAGADTSTTRGSVRVRWRTGIDAGMRVVSGSTTYEIKAVLPNRRGGYIDLACEAVNVRT